MPEHVRSEIKLTINRSGTALILRHPAQIPSSVYLVLVLVPSPEESRRLLRWTLVGAGIVAFVLASLVALNLTVSGRARVLDSYLYVFDARERIKRYELSILLLKPKIDD